MPHLPLIPRGSKIGYHSISPGQVIPFTQAMAERGAPLSLVKAIANPGVALDVKRVSPATLTIVRFFGPWHTCHDIEKGFFPYAQAARETLDHVFANTSPVERANIDRYEVLNEPDPPGEQGYHNLALFCLALMDEAAARGVRLALPTFNAGTPEYYEMLAMADTGVFERMAQGSHWLSIHEGVFGDQDVDHLFGALIPGAPFVPPGAGALCFRYRYLLDIIKRRHGHAPAIVVTEFVAGGGYETAQPAAAVRERLAWYDAGIRQDPEVLTVCPFTFDPGDGWQHQSYDYILPTLADYLYALRKEPNAIEPAPVPTWPGLARVGGVIGRNLRTGPGLEHPMVALAYRGRILRILAAHGAWLEARLFIHESGVTPL